MSEERGDLWKAFCSTSDGHEFTQATSTSMNSISLGGPDKSERARKRKEGKALLKERAKAKGLSKEAIKRLMDSHSSSTHNGLTQWGSLMAMEETDVDKYIDNWQAYLGTMRRAKAAKRAQERRETARKNLAQKHYNMLGEFRKTMEAQPRLGMFKSGDVARVLDISPRQARKMVANMHDWNFVEHMKNGWWSFKLYGGGTRRKPKRVSRSKLDGWAQTGSTPYTATWNVSRQQQGNAYQQFKGLMENDPTENMEERNMGRRAGELALQDLKDAQLQRTSQVVQASQAGLVSKKSAMAAMGIDWGAEFAKLNTRQDDE